MKGILFVCLFVCLHPIKYFELSGRSHAGTLLQLKNRNRSARDVCVAFATHAGLVYDVTDTDCCAGTNWQLSLTVVFLQTFRHPFRNTRDVQVETVAVLYFIRSISLIKVLRFSFSLRLSLLKIHRYVCLFLIFFSFLFFFMAGRVQELCESRCGRPGLPVPNSPYGFCGRKATLNWNFMPGTGQSETDFACFASSLFCLPDLCVCVCVCVWQLGYCLPQYIKFHFVAPDRMEWNVTPSNAMAGNGVCSAEC